MRLDGVLPSSRAFHRAWGIVAAWHVAEGGYLVLCLRAKEKEGAYATSDTNTRLGGSGRGFVFPWQHLSSNCTAQDHLNPGSGEHNQRWQRLDHPRWRAQQRPLLDAEPDQHLERFAAQGCLDDPPRLGPWLQVSVRGRSGRRQRHDVRPDG